jgi:hypothetical protein
VRVRGGQDAAWEHAPRAVQLVPVAESRLRLELRRDMELAERLEKEGKSPIEIILATSYPSDGIEFAIRRSKLPGQRWLVRLSASAVVGGKPGMLVYPAATAERTTQGWLELRLR